jgi:hypothetical protein
VWRLNEIREMLELRRRIDELDRASYQEQHAGTPAGFTAWYLFLIK